MQLVGNCILQISIPPGDSQGERRQKGLYLRQSAHCIANPFIYKQTSCYARRVQNLKHRELQHTSCRIS